MADRIVTAKLYRAIAAVVSGLTKWPKHTRTVRVFEPLELRRLFSSHTYHGISDIADASRRPTGAIPMRPLSVASDSGISTKSAPRYDSPFEIIVRSKWAGDANVRWEVNWGDDRIDRNAEPKVLPDGRVAFSHVYDSPYDLKASTFEISVTAFPDDDVSEAQTIEATTAAPVASMNHTQRQNAVLDLYHQVRNTIELEIYEGAVKGPNSTLRTGRGNDWDQAWLLKVLIDNKIGATNLDPPYSERVQLVSEMVYMDLSEAKRWLGVSTPEAVAKLVALLSRDQQVPKNPASPDSDEQSFVLTSNNKVRLRHTYLKVTLPKPGDQGYEVFYLDPSFKYRELRTPARSPEGDRIFKPVGAATQYRYDPTAFARSVFPDGITRYDQSPLEWYEKQLADQLRQHLGSDGKPDWVGRYGLADLHVLGPIIPENETTLPTSLPFGRNIAANGVPLRYVGSSPASMQKDGFAGSNEDFRLKIRVSVNGTPGTDPNTLDQSRSVSIAEIDRKDLTIRYQASNEANGTRYSPFLYIDDDLAETETRPATQPITFFGFDDASGTGFQAHISIRTSTDFFEANGLPESIADRTHEFVRPPNVPVAIMVAANQLTERDVAEQWDRVNDFAEYAASITDVAERQTFLYDHYQPRVLALIAKTYAQRFDDSARQISELHGTAAASSGASFGVITGVHDEQIAEAVKSSVDGALQQTLKIPFVFSTEDNGYPTGYVDTRREIGFGVDLVQRYLPVVTRYDEPSGDSDHSEVSRESDAAILMSHQASFLESNVLEEVLNIDGVSTAKAFQWRMQRQTDENQTTEILKFKRRSDGEYECVAYPSFSLRSVVGNTQAYPLITESADDLARALAAEALALGDDTPPDVFIEFSTLVTRGRRGAVGEISVESHVGIWEGWAWYLTTIDPADQRAVSGGAFLLTKGKTAVTRGGYIASTSPAYYSSPAATQPRPEPYHAVDQATTNSVFGDPVNLFDGSLYHDESDFAIPLPALGFSFGRHYESTNRRDSGMGVGWSFSYSDELILDIDGAYVNRATWFTSAGQSHRFDHIANSGPSQFSNPGGIFGNLAKVGSKYEFVDESGTTYTFTGRTNDTDEERFRLSSVTDHVGNVFTIGYEDGGRQFSFHGLGETSRDVAAWNQYDSGDDRTIEIRDLQEPVPTQRRTWIYKLKKRGDGTYELAEFVAPSNGLAARDRVWTKYAYYTAGYRSGLLSEIIRGVGQPDFSQPANYANGRYRARHEYDYYPNRRAAKTTEYGVRGGDWFIKGKEYFDYDQFTSPSLDLPSQVYTSFTAGARHIDQNGHATKVFYDRAGMLTRTINADRTQTFNGWYLYNSPSGGDPIEGKYLPRYAVNEVGQSDLYEYSVASTDGLRINGLQSGVVTSLRSGAYAFDGLNIQDALGGTLTETGYVIRDGVKLPGVITINRERATTFQYYESGPWSGLLEYQLDAEQNLTRFLNYNLYGQLIKQVNPIGAASGSSAANQVVYSYDSITGLMLSEVRGLRPDQTWDSVRSFTYDGRGNLESSTRGRFSVSSPFESVVTTYEYDILNRKTEERVGLNVGPTDQSSLTKYFYLDDLLTKTESLYKKAPSSVNDVFYVNEFAYDLAGRLVEKKVNGKSSTNEYDPLGNLVATTDEMLAVTRYFFDERNRQLAIEAPDRSFSFGVYDSLGRVQMSARADDSGLSYYRSWNQFDRHGLPQVSVDALGQRVETTYRLAADQAHSGNPFVFPEIEQTSWFETLEAAVPWRRDVIKVRDGLGRIRESRSTTGEVASTEYDPNGNLRSVTRYNVDSVGNFMSVDRSVLDALPPSLRIRTVTTYDAADRPVAVTNGEGETVRTFYDAADRVTDVIDPRGSGVTVTAAGEPQVDLSLEATSFDPKYRTTTEYDATGRVARTLLPAVDGEVAEDRDAISYQYSRNGLLWSEIRMDGRFTNFGYDYRTGAVTTEDATGKTAAETKDDAGRLRSMTDRLGRTTTFSYDAMGREISRKLPATQSPSQEFTTFYGFAGNPISVVDVASGVTTASTFDALGRAIAVEQHLTAAPQTLLSKVENTYERGNLATVTTYRDAQTAYLTKYDYDDAGRLTGEIRHSSPISSQPPVGDADIVVWTKGYDSLGRLTVDTVFLRESDGEGVVTKYSYDRANRLIMTDGAVPDSFDDHRGSKTEFVYDDAGNRIKVLAYPSHNGDGVSYPIEWNAYDTRNRLVRSHRAAPGDPPDSVLYPEGVDLPTQYWYDANDNILKEIDPEQNVIEYKYDALNRVTREIRHVSLSESVRDVRVEKVYTYDTGWAGNDWVSVEDFHPAPAGQSVTEHGPVTTWKYDALGLLSSVSSLGGLQIDYTYTANGFLYTATNNTNTIFNRTIGIEQTHDALGRLKEEKQSGFAGSGNSYLAPDARLTWTYDFEGRPTSSEVFSGSTLESARSYRYDAGGSATEVLRIGAGASSTGERFVIGRFLDGQAESISPLYDASSTVTGNVVNSAKRVYARNGAGQLTDITAFNGSFHYEYQRNRIGRVTSMSGGGSTKSYGYQRDGQLVQDNSVSLGYNHNQNRVQSGYDTGKDNRLLSDGVWKYTYDHRGNVVTKVSIATGQKWLFAYDVLNRQTTVEKLTGGGIRLAKTQYVYDALGRRVAKLSLSQTSSDIRQPVDPGPGTQDGQASPDNQIPPGGSTGGVTAPDDESMPAALNSPFQTMDVLDGLHSERYTLDGNNVVRVDTLSSTQTKLTDGTTMPTYTSQFKARYTYSPGATVPLSEDRAAITGVQSGGLRFLIADENGSVRRSIDTGGSTMAEVDYDAFGNRTLAGNTQVQDVSRFQYGGQEYDEETGLGYFDARYYSASIGRFLTADPAEEGTNHYAYVGNDPVNYTDPSGLGAFHGAGAVAQGGMTPSNVLSSFAATGQVGGGSPSFDYSSLQLSRADLLSASSAASPFESPLADPWGGMLAQGAPSGSFANRSVPEIDAMLYANRHNPVTSALSVPADIAKGIGHAVAHPVETHGRIVNDTAAFLAANTSEDDVIPAWLKGTSYLVSSAVGARSLGEAGFGADVTTHRALTTSERWQRGLAGGGGLLLTGAALGSTLPKAILPEPSGFPMIFNSATSTPQRMLFGEINSFGAGATFAQMPASAVPLGSNALTIMSRAALFPASISKGLGYQNALYKAAVQTRPSSDFTIAGRQLPKHPEVVGLTKANFRDFLRTDPAINKAAHASLRTIMRNGVMSTRMTGRYGEVIQIRIPGGFGARWGANGKFIGFMNP